MEVSTDASASRGGLLAPMSRLDPSYPAAIRQAVWALDGAGELSDPIMLTNGYAIVQLVREIEAAREADADAPPGANRAELERLVRLSQERILMDQLARRLMAGVSVTIFDDSLQDSWQRARRAAP